MDDSNTNKGQGVNITIAGDGNSMTVNDATTQVSNKCGDIWGSLFGSMAAMDEDTFEHTERMHQDAELNPIEDQVDLHNNG